MFDFRNAVLVKGQVMHILVTGGTGFIGSALIPALVDRGDNVTVLSRRAHVSTPAVTYVSSFDDIPEQVDAVINLAGASLADKRWSARYKKIMLASRVETTERLVAWMQAQPTPVKMLLSGSAIGYYGSSETSVVTEQCPSGAGVSADLCLAWEQAAKAGVSPHTRVVLLRLGVVLDAGGGALVEMLRSFSVGVGSWVGSGRQWLSWIHRGDVVKAILFLLDNETIAGPVNLVAPEVVTHREFCAVASRVKRVLLQLGVPGFALKLMVGEMAEELLLNGQRVQPQVLVDNSFRFAHSTLESALRSSLTPSG